MALMANKQDEILNDSIQNLGAGLPVAQAAKLHGVSRQRASQVLKENGIKIDRSNGTLTVPISRLNTITKLR